MPDASDPMDALCLPSAPADPGPAFAQGLRARIERALRLPKGVTVTTTTADATETTVAPPDTPGATIPYLAVDGARRAIDWYADVFGARLLGEPYVMDDDRIGHAELALAGGRLYLADAHPEIGVTAPRPGESPVSLMLAVEDADDTRRRAVAAGASGDREPYEGYGRRNAWIVDPFGHRWGLHSPLPAEPSAGGFAYRHGDIGYVSLWVPDAARAQRFYAAVLGWDFTAAGQVAEGTVPPIGTQGGVEPPTLFCSYAVDDVDAAVQRVRAAGGQAGEPAEEPYGRTAMCTDNQSTRFAIYQTVESGDRIGPNGARSGDLGYLTLQVADSAAAREFYGAVLGWTIAPGRAEDGWMVQDARPMTGLHGGHERGTGVPMWLVDDVPAAARRVRDAGGTATEPEQQPYGLMSTCSDDQGSSFYLGRMDD